MFINSFPPEADVFLFYAVKNICRSILTYACQKIVSKAVCKIGLIVRTKIKFHKLFNYYWWSILEGVVVLRRFCGIVISVTVTRM